MFYSIFIVCMCVCVYVCVFGREFVEYQSGLPVHTTECQRTVFSYVCVFSTFLQDRLKSCYI